VASIVVGGGSFTDWEDDDFDVNVPTDKEGVEGAVVESTPEDSAWLQALTDTSAAATTRTKLKTTPKEDKRRPLLLIDFTRLSSGAVHNKFDINGVNDPDKKKEMTTMCTTNFVFYRDNVEMIENGIVRSCGQSVWRDALAELRRENPGHFWAPIFPPKELK
jgi:hypothetical protein